MDKRKRHRVIEKWRWWLLVGALGLLLLQGACVVSERAQEKDGGMTSPAVREGAQKLNPSFKSDRYVVYMLSGQETPEQLAQEFLGDSRKKWVIEEANPNTPFATGQIIVIPLKDWGRGGLTPDGYQVMPVLCFHRFGQKCKSRLCISSTAFEAQLRYLKENGYQTIGISDLLDFLEFRKALPKKAVMITIDDGYSSVYEIAYPLLLKYGFTATLFIYTDFIAATSSALKWDMLKEMVSHGFDVGSHTVSHCNLGKHKEGETDDAYAKRIEAEISESKIKIDAKLNYNTVALAFPYGEYNQKVLQIMGDKGYKMGFSVKRGSNAFFADPLTLRRNQILFEDMNEFSSRLKTFQPLRLR